MESDNTTDPVTAQNPLTIAVNVFVAPTEAFGSLDRKPVFLFPLALVVIASIAVYSWYFSVVDYKWLIDQMIARMSDLPSDQLEAVRKAYGSMSVITMMISTNVSIVISLIVVNSIQAGYLTLASALIGNSYRFRHWFSLTCWTALPAMLVILGMVVNVLVSDNGQIGLYELNPLSFNNLGLPAAGNTSLQALLNTLNVATFWSLGLMVAGYHYWLDSGYLKASLIVLVPHVLIYGAWAAIAVL